MGFSRQEYWSGLPFPSPGDLPDQGSDPGLLQCRRILYQLSYEGSPHRNSSRLFPVMFPGSLFLSAYTLPSSAPEGPHLAGTISRVSEVG